MTHETSTHARNESRDTYDAVVVGGGAGGLSAALVLGRARRRVAVVDSGSPRNAPAARMHGFLSRDGLPPAELLRIGRAEVTAYGVELTDGRVESVGSVATPSGAPLFDVRLADGTVLRARRVVAATGLRDELPEFPGVRERWGRDVLHCPYCHGYEVRDRPLGVLGTQPHSAQHALLIRQWSADLVYFPHSVALGDDDRAGLDARGVRIVEGAVAEVVVEEGALRGIRLADGRFVAREAVFVAPRFVPRDGPLAGLGCARDEAGWVLTDPTGLTSVPGVWVIGNAADPRAQVVSAAGAGSAAAAALNHSLVDEDTTRALTPDPATP
ncbi:NAD(P)/FAD-dependent oxidoreductase [Streptomyces candidus]|uniref:Thioredoxin reductase n=1 Tax=Streptomyces candidus TaxID=67283 RepID=A0A7X0HD05_9ACTN|nr:NAD(P)/FAD-dependent oxidoreductase [Streptomyces candidus]MBB6433928.1 thioredoxin reductase [Streptomyces candidus]